MLNACLGNVKVLIKFNCTILFEGRCHHVLVMILGEDPKHVFQLDTNLSLSLSLCLSPSLRLSLSLVLDLASILVSALVLVLVLVLALGLARRPEAASGSHLEANIGNSSFS